MPIEQKPPSAKDRSVSFDVPANKDPYYVEWFQNTKEQGDSIEAFLLRILDKQVRAYFVRKANVEDMEDLLGFPDQNNTDSEFLED